MNPMGLGSIGVSLTRRPDRACWIASSEGFGFGRIGSADQFEFGRIRFISMRVWGESTLLLRKGLWAPSAPSG